MRACGAAIGGDGRASRAVSQRERRRGGAALSGRAVRAHAEARECGTYRQTLIRVSVHCAPLSCSWPRPGAWPLYRTVCACAVREASPWERSPAAGAPLS